MNRLSRSAPSGYVFRGQHVIDPVAWGSFNKIPVAQNSMQMLL